MAPRIPREQDLKKMDSSSGSGSEEEMLDLPAGEEEYHTSDSDLSADEQDGLGKPVHEGEDGEEEDEEEGEEEEEHHTDSSPSDDEEEAAAQPAKPYLPSHLLTTPTATPARHTLKEIPWPELTAKQKRNQKKAARLKQRKALARLQTEAKDTGALQAGKAAGDKRGVVVSGTQTGDRVRTGRVGKMTRGGEAGTGGRQKMLESRRQAIAAKAVTTGGTGKKNGKVRKGKGGAE